MTDNVEHEIQRQMLTRLGIEWTPGEPFYSLVEAEIERLKIALLQIRNFTDEKVVREIVDEIIPPIPATSL